MSAANSWHELQFRLKDSVRHSDTIRSLSGYVDSLRGTVSSSVAIRAQTYAAAYGKTRSLDRKRQLAGRLQGLMTDNRAGDLTVHPRFPSSAANPLLNRGIILKAPGPDGEKGVLHLTPEYNWLKFFTVPAAVRDVTSRFDLWLTASWGPADYHLLLHALQVSPEVLFVSPGHHTEIPSLEAFDPRIRCVPLIASDWLDPACFRPKPWAERTTDILMVANFSPYKRHWHFFSILRHLPKDLRVTLIGQRDGPHTIDNIQRQARILGVTQEIRFLENLPAMSQVHDEECNSRVSLITSRREGACVVIAESLFANTPVALLRGANVGTTAYVNDQTGVLLDEFNFGPQLMRLLEAGENLTPRAWAIENIACGDSIRKANEVFRKYAASKGLKWTRDLTPFCWYPNPTYMTANDRAALLPLYDELGSRYPMLFGPQFVPDVLVRPFPV